MSEAREGLSRRRMLGGVALAAVLSQRVQAEEPPPSPGPSPSPEASPSPGAVSSTETPPADKPPFVLVHGAWHGGWCWRKVVPLLRAAGHAVHTPTLTGVGERAHLLSREVNLLTHVKDIAGLLEFEDLHGAILVGHSYAGMIIPAVAAQAGARVGRVVHLDAYVPKSNTSTFDNMSPHFVERWRQVVASKGEGWKVPPLLDAKAMGITDATDAAWVDARLRPMPLGAFDQKVSFDARALEHLPRAYVRCAGFAGFGPMAQKARAQGFEVREIPAGHDAMVAAPGALAKALLELSR